MKKIRIVISVFTLICILSVLASCGKSECKHVYDYECDSECNICGEKREASHNWSKDDKLLCQYQLTCDWCCASVGEDVEHIYTDANGNVLNECAICGAKNPTPPNESNQNNTQGGSTTDSTPEPNPTPDDKPEINTTTLQYTYDYGWHVLGELTLLCDDGHLHIDGIEKPADIVAGDMIKIVHTGSIWTQESYPATHSLSSGGYLISYSFEYATVIHLGSYGYSIENVKSQYDLDEEYVIVDRTGNCVPLDEYNGDEIYLVVDQKRYPYYGNGDFTDIDMEYPEEIIPIASMFAYNPRDLEDGVNVRSQKVTINLDEHTEYPWGDHPTNKYAGCIGYNENLNQYIKYAPNTFRYLVTVTCTDIVSEAFELSKSIINDNHSALVSTVENQILIEFPNFDSYSMVENELLDGLSGLESVQKIEIDYDESSANVEKTEGYEHYTGFKATKSDTAVITTYDEFLELFDLTDERNSEISKITAETFENNYVIYGKVGTGHCVEWIIFNDIKIIDGKIYCTLYEIYYADKMYCCVYSQFPALIVVPKSDLGAELPKEPEIIFFNIDIYTHKEENVN